jgi:two-component system LytT family sensor kinase
MTDRDRRPDLAACIRIVLLIVSVWVAFAFFNSSEFYQAGVATGNAMQTWADALVFQLAASLVWATLTPIIIFIAERLPIQKPHRMRNAALLLPIVPLLAAVRAVVGGATLQLSEGDTPTVAFALLSTRIRFHQNVFLTLVIVGVTNFVLARRSARARERAAFALQSAVTDAEIQRLRVTIQPRYIFSALEEIAARVRTQPAVADRILVELSELLRGAQELARREYVSLGEELELIDRYFDIEKTRTGGRFTARIVLAEELLGAQVPSMILRPLVESACAAGAADVARTFEIRGRTAEDMLILEISHERVEDAGDALVARPDDEAAYAGASVQRRIEGNRFVTEIRLPLVLPEEANAS